MKLLHCLFGVAASILFGVSSGVHAATIYINPDGTGDQPTIQAGVGVAAPGDTLLLAAGTFVGAGNKDVIFGKDLVVRSESGAATTVVDCEGSGRGFLYVLGETAASLLRGVTIRNGDPNGSGGAVLVVNTSPTFVECVFQSNTGSGSIGSGGGAVYCTASSPTFQDCHFNENQNPSIDGSGGAIALSDCIQVQILGCSFEGNTASLASFSVGGAVSDWFSSQVTISGCDFRRNAAKTGGAVALIQTDEAEIATSTFFGNSAGFQGGGLVGSSLNLRVTDCQFVGNQAAVEGGGASLSYYPVEFERCSFQDNRSTEWGGAVVSFGAAGLYTGCIFSRNSARLGGAIFIGENSTVVQHCTFHANTAEQGSVFRTRGGNAGASHSVFAFNVGAVASCAGGGVTLACCDVYGTVGGDYVGCIAGQGNVDANFSADPLFCGKDAMDFTLELNSPCAPPGITGCGLVGALPVGCGPTSVAPASWGEVKERYRGSNR
jgi:hypothetical protein